MILSKYVSFRALRASKHFHFASCALFFFNFGTLLLRQANASCPHAQLLTDPAQLIFDYPLFTAREPVSLRSNWQGLRSDVTDPRWLTYHWVGHLPFVDAMDLLRSAPKTFEAYKSSFDFDSENFVRAVLISSAQGMLSTPQFLLDTNQGLLEKFKTLVDAAIKETAPEFADFQVTWIHPNPSFANPRSFELAVVPKRLESVPLTWFTQLLRFHAKFPRIRTQLQVLIPTERLSARQSMELARIAESLFVLQTASDEFPSSWSYFARPVTHETGPSLTHLLKLNGAPDLPRALWTLHFISQLAANPDRIRTLDFDLATHDRLPASARACRYLARHLEAQNTPISRETAQQLKKLADGIEKDPNLSPEQRQHIHVSLKRMDALKKINHSTFLTLYAPGMETLNWEQINPITRDYGPPPTDRRDGINE